MIPGDAIPGGFQVGRTPWWHVPHTDWERTLFSGWGTDPVLKNEAPANGHTVTLGVEHDPGDAIQVSREDVPWIVDTFESAGVTYNRWRVNWYRFEGIYEEFYDWTKCSPDYDPLPINKWRYWSNEPGQCFWCLRNEGGGVVDVGTAPSSAKTALHKVHYFYSDFLGRHVFHSVRRYVRASPGGPKAPAFLGRFVIQQVWEMTAKESLGQPPDFPRPSGVGLIP